MIGVTIGTGEYYTKLAQHAAQAIEKMTGVKTIILGDEHLASSGLPYSHHLKLRIFDLVDHDQDVDCLLKHGRLDAEIKARIPVEEPRRVLAGAHDVETDRENREGRP